FVTARLSEHGSGEPHPREPVPSVLTARGPELLAADGGREVDLVALWVCDGPGDRSFVADHGATRSESGFKTTLQLVAGEVQVDVDAVALGAASLVGGIHGLEEHRHVQLPPVHDVGEVFT